MSSNKSVQRSTNKQVQSLFYPILTHSLSGKLAWFSASRIFWVVSGLVIGSWLHVAMWMWWHYIVTANYDIIVII